MLPSVALIGRPNVGKSTLFNRLIKSNRAITHDQPGVTRDRMYGQVRDREGRDFRLIDTGGVTLNLSGEPADGPGGLRGFEREVMEQAKLAMAESHVLALVVDGRDGLLPLDEQLAGLIRASGKPMLLVVNKVDGYEHEDALTAEFHALGMDMAPCSAEHGYGLRDLKDTLQSMLPPEEDEDLFGGTEAFEDDPDDETITNIGPRIKEDLRIAMLGRPNAGKSSIVNALMGENRMIVSDLPGTTRDSVDVSIRLDEKEAAKRREKGGEGPVVLGYTFVDTAGVRRRTRISDKVEQFSVNAALKSSRKAEVTVFVQDATEGVTTQDKKLISYLDREKIPFMIVVNKIDLIPREETKALKQAYDYALRICPHVPVLYTSALKGRGLVTILKTAESLFEECGRKIGTGLLNRTMTEAINRHQPPVVKRIRAKFYYLTQVGANPPAFIFFVNDPDRVKPSYVRYLENQMRKHFNMPHAPLSITFKRSHEKRSFGKSKTRKK